MVTPKEVITALQLSVLVRTDAGRIRRDLAARVEEEGIAPPDGYAVVPIEPTVEMMCAGGDLFDGDSFGWATKCYKAMLAATPKPEND